MIDETDSISEPPFDAVTLVIVTGGEIGVPSEVRIVPSKIKFSTP